MTKDHVPGARRAIPRSRGAVSGVALIVLGAWGALIPFIGPYFNFSFTPDDAWHWTSARGWLEVLPGAAAFVAGVLLLMSRSRSMTLVASWLGIAAGAWFAVGPQLQDVWKIGSPGQPAGSGSGIRVLESLAMFTLLGVVIVYFAASAFGRLSVVSTRDQRAAERRETEAAAAREQEAAAAREREEATARERAAAAQQREAAEAQERDRAAASAATAPADSTEPATAEPETAGAEHRASGDHRVRDAQSGGQQSYGQQENGYPEQGSGQPAYSPQTNGQQAYSPQAADPQVAGHQGYNNPQAYNPQGNGQQAYGQQPPSDGASAAAQPAAQHKSQSWMQRVLHRG